MKNLLQIAPLTDEAVEEIKTYFSAPHPAIYLHPALYYPIKEAFAKRGEKLPAGVKLVQIFT